MKITFLTVALFLSALVIYFYNQSQKREADLNQAYETIRVVKAKQEHFRESLYENWENIGEKPLEISDTIVEIHRIWSTLGNKAYLLKIECGKDSTLRSVFKQFTLKNPLTNEGETQVLVNKSMVVNPTDFYAFKSQLAKISLADAAISSEDIMCCFGGGSITWEAKMANGDKYYFSTFCRKSIEFAVACEVLMEKCGFAEPSETVH